nr:unnamed protein product [Digitaria exilis]
MSRPPLHHGTSPGFTVPSKSYRLLQILPPTPLAVRTFKRNSTPVLALSAASVRRVRVTRILSAILSPTSPLLPSLPPVISAPNRLHRKSRFEVTPPANRLPKSNVFPRRLLTPPILLAARSKRILVLFSPRGELGAGRDMGVSAVEVILLGLLLATLTLLLMVFGGGGEAARRWPAWRATGAGGGDRARAAVGLVTLLLLVFGGAGSQPKLFSSSPRNKFTQKLAISGFLLTY